MPLKNPVPATPLFQFEYIGTRADAIRHLIARIPALNKIEDTTVQWHEPHSPSGDMQDFINALRSSKAEFCSITEPVQDESYVNALYSVYGERRGRASGRTERLQSFRLHHESPLMNFVLLYEENKDSEVLFGFGTHRADLTNKETPVFLSSNELLVKEFQRLFKELCTPRFSSPINVNDPEFLRSRRDRGCDVLATFPYGFPTLEIEERIKDCREKRIVICTTAWPSFDSFKQTLKNTLKSNCSTIDLALWDKNSPFNDLRNATSGDREGLEQSIEANIITLKSFTGVQNFRVHSIPQHNAHGSEMIKICYIRQTPWDLVVIDEAHRLRNVYRSGNKIANAIGVFPGGGKHHDRHHGRSRGHQPSVLQPRRQL